LSGANPTIASYNVSGVNFYNAPGIFYSTLKNYVAYYNPGVVAVNSKVIRLAPGFVNLILSQVRKPKSLEIPWCIENQIFY
jgi:hypothetical protein